MNKCIYVNDVEVIMGLQMNWENKTYNNSTIFYLFDVRNLNCNYTLTLLLNY